MWNFLNERKAVFIFSVILAGLNFLLMGAGGSTALAQSADAFVRWVRSVEANKAGITHPVGLAFSPASNAFYVIEDGSQTSSALTNTENTTPIVKVTPHGDRLASVSIAAVIEDSINMAFDSRFGRLLIYDATTNELLSVVEGADGTLNPATLTRHAATHFGVEDPQGMAFDQETEVLYLLDGADRRLVRVAPDANGSFAGATVTAVDLPAALLTSPRGLAYDPTTRHVHVANVDDQQLYELTPLGEMVATRDLAQFNLSQVQGLVFAPSADATDNPQQFNLYLADSGADGRLASVQAKSQTDAQSAKATEEEQEPARPLESSETPQLNNQLYLSLLLNGTADSISDGIHPPGQIVEFSFVDIPRSIVRAAAFTPNLVQTIDASLWSPPSPDSSGIVYLPVSPSISDTRSNTLLVSDGEVNETALYEGANMWHTTLAGAVVSTWTTLSYSDEPTGLALNPSNGHLFVSDDTGVRTIYEVDPVDGIYGNGNDSVSSFRTGGFLGADITTDPEGVTYASDLGVLFIVDGVNREVYRVAPGSNGVFDGIAPSGDDQLTHFDVLSLGIGDPEGIAYNSDTGTLYIVGTSSNNELFEVTTEGQLVRVIDVSVLGARNMAGLDYAPSSGNPAEMSIYIVTRGVDNDIDPNENDGKIYELRLLNAAPSVDPITGVPTGPIPVGTVVNASTTFSDPDATDTHTATWDWGDGNVTPGTVTETSGSGTASGSHIYATPGTYTITVTITDIDGASGQSFYTPVVVHAPDGESVKVRVKGNGEIASPPGSSPLDPAITDGLSKTHFDVQIGYETNATVPTGKLKLKLDDKDKQAKGKIDFTADTFESLTIEGAKATSQGTGTIKDYPGRLGFLLTAIDEELTTSTDLDLFRLKIWDMDNGNAIIYDNEMGQPDDAAPTTPITKGKIEIEGSAATAVSINEPAVLDNDAPAALPSQLNGITADEDPVFLFLPAVMQ